MKLVYIKSLIRRKIIPSSERSMANNGKVEASNDQPDKIGDMLMHLKMENQDILDEMENHFKKDGDQQFPKL